MNAGSSVIHHSNVSVHSRLVVHRAQHSPRPELTDHPVSPRFLPADRCVWAGRLSPHTTHRTKARGGPPRSPAERPDTDTHGSHSPPQPNSASMTGVCAEGGPCARSEARQVHELCSEWSSPERPPYRSASVKERGLSSGVRARAFEAWSSLRFDERVLEVPHQGVLLRGGSVARHLSAPRGCMVRSGHDPQGLNQFVDVATGVGVMPIPSSLGVVSELHAAARCWRQRISPSRRP